MRICFFKKEVASYPLCVVRGILAFFGTMCICLQLGSFFVSFVQVSLSLFVALFIFEGMMPEISCLDAKGFLIFNVSDIFCCSVFIILIGVCVRASGLCFC